MFHFFPYTNVHELNLDWILEKIKEVENSVVLSVNGQTGAVVLFVDDGYGIKFPNISADQWNIRRDSDGKTTGIEFRKDVGAFLINGNQRSKIYSEANPQPIPVQSVNGETGAVHLYSEDEYGINFPGTEETQWNLRKDAEGTVTGIEFHKNNGAYRMNGVDRYKIYDTGNPPPYPVKSVNGKTGVVKTPFKEPASTELELDTAVSAGGWGIKREITGGKLAINFEGSSAGAQAYLDFYNAQGTRLVHQKLLTPADIPATSGVVSVNGKVGVVVLDGTDINVDNTAQTPETVAAAITRINSKTSQDIKFTPNSPDDLYGSVYHQINELGIRAGQLEQWKNSTANPKFAAIEAALPLKAGMKHFTIDSSSSKTFELTGGFKGIVILNGQRGWLQGLYLLSSNTAGSASAITPIGTEPTNVSVTYNRNEFTFSNADTTLSLDLQFIYGVGDVAEVVVTP